MKKRTAQPLVIGQWEDCIFKPLADQPPKPITSIIKMNTWASEQELPVGEYSLIRRLPGKLLVSEQLIFDFKKG